MASPNLPNAAANPSEASTAAGRVKQHDLSQQIAYDRYAKAQAAAATATRGAIFSKIIPAAPIPDQQGTNAANSDQSFDTPGF